MAKYRDQLPQLERALFLTDGGIETTLIFVDGIDLPSFAAFPLLDDADGRAALVRYFDSYAELAQRDGVGIVLETPTWRASADWGASLGYSRDDLVRLNRDAVDLLVDVRNRFETEATPIVISGCIGPRGDGYVPGELLSPAESQEIHSLQTGAFASSEADLVTAITMTYPDEAIGIVEAAKADGMPVVISFTVETDGRLPSGEALGDAIETVDAATDGYAAYFMINCAHPTHFGATLAGGGAWVSRLGGLRANASSMSHAELDEAEELDRGNPNELAQQYVELRGSYPSLCVLGGCCGTDTEHITAISRANLPA